MPINHNSKSAEYKNIYNEKGTEVYYLDTRMIFAVDGNPRYRIAATSSCCVYGDMSFFFQARNQGIVVRSIPFQYLDG